jgi:hypothetical protein
MASSSKPIAAALTAVFAGAAVLTACAPTISKPLDVSKIKSIRLCRTHKSDLVSWFGKPSREKSQPKTKSAEVEWRFAKGGVIKGLDVQALRVRLDRHDRVIGFDLDTFTGDSALSRQGACITRLRSRSALRYGLD